MNFTSTDFQNVRTWVYRNARPLDLARWQVYFENGSPSTVLDALMAYQNPDGGFGHALEPDFWNPSSSPMAAQIAVKYLEEIQFRDSRHPLIQGILKFLSSGADFDGCKWSAIIDSNADFPHAPWWVDRSYDWGFSPTATLAGFAIFHAAQESPLHQKACQIAAVALETYLNGVLPDGEPYRSKQREGEIQSFTSLLDFIEAAGLKDSYPVAAMRKALMDFVEGFIEKDPSKWGSYCWKPSMFVRSPASPFYPGNEQAIEDELEYIFSRRNAEGVWDTNWTWGAYDSEYAISTNWWKANLAIENLLLLKAFGHLNPD